MGTRPTWAWGLRLERPLVGTGPSSRLAHAGDFQRELIAALHNTQGPGADVAGPFPVPAQMWEGLAKSRCRSGKGLGGPRPGADVGREVVGNKPLSRRNVSGVSPVPVQMRQQWAKSPYKCGSDGPSPDADAGGVSPVPVQMRQQWALSDPLQTWLRRGESRCRCGQAFAGRTRSSMI